MDEQQAFGSYLRRERELRQIPLAEVAAATKIPQHSLELLEQGDWDTLPAPIFVRGFVRSYSRYLGLSEAEVSGRFNDILTQKDEAELLAEEIPLDEQVAVDVGGRRKFGLALVVIIVLILATITLSLFWRSGSSFGSQASANTPRHIGTWQS